MNLSVNGPLSLCFCPAALSPWALGGVDGPSCPSWRRVFASWPFLSVSPPRVLSYLLPGAKE